MDRDVHACAPQRRDNARDVLQPAHDGIGEQRNAAALERGRMRTRLVERAPAESDWWSLHRKGGLHRQALLAATHGGPNG